MNTASSTTAQDSRLVIPFASVGIDDVPLVGGKNASLGEMIRELRACGIQVPDGFATTASAYRSYLTTTGLQSLVHQLLDGIDVQNISDLQRRGQQVRDAILQTSLTNELSTAITEAYGKLCQSLNPPSPIAVAVRSSATAEDLPDASFAGQQETFLNVVGEQALLDSCQKCFASLFTDRAIAYRTHHGFDHFEVALSIGIQRMVAADSGTSGVIFTVDTETGFAQAVLINASWGLGENVVKGTVNPDEFIVFKGTLDESHRPIIQKRLGSKQFKMIGCANSGANGSANGNTTENVPVEAAQRNQFSLTDDEILQLARWAIRIEEHYSSKNGRPTPMDIEFAKDGITGELFIVQARPETVQSRRSTNVIRKYRLVGKGAAMVTGSAVGQRISSGVVRLINNPNDLGQFQPGDVLVAEKTDPDWEPIMKKAAAIVTDHGGRTCHAAIVARELGLPAVVGTNDGTRKLRDGMPVTVSCAAGETGFVYEGQLDFEVDEIDLQELPQTHTRVMVNLANPGLAFSLAALPLDGVGLARLEFIISDSVKVHPNALLQFDQLDESLKRSIAEVTAGYENKTDYFVDKMAQGVAMIAAAFYPRDVIVRFSDFKSNEYANLIGGAGFELPEENPMLGFRGAARYAHPRYRDCFALECRAMKRVRQVMGLTNVKLMIPFCRTVDEGRQVIELMAQHGLARGEDGLEVYVMCEIPSNVLLAAEFAEVFDGFSIGSNDLTQLTLGIDRDSEIVAHVFDERNPAVLKIIEMAIAAAKAADSPIGICGQAPSDFPEITRFLVEQGINSISVTPDVALKTRLLVAEAEKAVASA